MQLNDEIEYLGVYTVTYCKAFYRWRSAFSRPALSSKLLLLQVGFTLPGLFVVRYMVQPHITLLVVEARRGSTAKSTGRVDSPYLDF